MINKLSQILHEVTAYLKANWKPVLIGLVLGAAAIGVFMPRHAANMNMGHDMNSMSDKKIKYWTCSMHPQIKLPESGQCPICGMDLIPVYEGGQGSGGSDGEVSLTLNETARKLAEVETAEVTDQVASNEVRLTGKVDYDEARLSYITAWVPGRIDRLFVDFTGTKVNKGDHLIDIYSPELISAQEEYIQAIKNRKDTKNSELRVVRDTAKSTLASSKEKLRLLGLKDEQINKIAKASKTQEHLTIYSPISGTVIHKEGVVGKYVKTGDKIYTIADLSKVWLFLDAYESDIQWLHYGQEVEITAESYPGEMFYGRISFIDPYVDEKTRTIKVRVNASNKDEKLKPGMFVRATVHATLGEEGKVYEEALAGKWICSMHPDVIKDKKGKCDICGMDLVPTSNFGFALKPSKDKKVMIIPKTAPLVTGKRAVVYVENINDKTGVHRYEGREVVLGPLAGDNYVVLSGLKPGERVVTKGNFKIDSALQIQAQPSMMNPAGYYSEKASNVLSQNADESFIDAGILKDALPHYFHVTHALAKDDAESAKMGFKMFKQEVRKVIDTKLKDKKKEGLAKDIESLAIELNTTGNDIDSMRKKLFTISDMLKQIFDKYEYKEASALYLAYCPMALNNTGGWWLQDNDKIANPYFGPQMQGCGEIKKHYGRMIMNDAKPMTGHNHH